VELELTGRLLHALAQLAHGDYPLRLRWDLGARFAHVLEVSDETGLIARFERSFTTTTWTRTDHAAQS
jgi:hypothetical protein